MKKILIMAGVGVALFVGTVFGLLAVQDRLNYQGTRSIPIVSSLFPPKTDKDIELAAEEEAKAKASEEKDGEAQGGDGHGEDSHKTYGPEEGPSKIKPKEDSGGHGGGHSAAPAGETHGTMPEVVDTGGQGRAYSASLPEDLKNKERYFPGAYFSFKRQQSSMSASDLKTLLAHILKQEGLLERKEHALSVREDNFITSGKGTDTRYSSISARLTQLKIAQTDLNLDIKEFNSRSANLEKEGAAAALKVYSDDLARLVEEDGQKAKTLIVAMFGGGAESKRMIMDVLELLKSDVFNQVLAEMDEEVVKNVITERFYHKVKKGNEQR